MLLAVLLKCFTIFLITNPILTDDPDRFEFEDCGSSGVIIHEIDMTPTPFMSPGIIQAKLKATVTRFICKYLRSLKGAKFYFIFLLSAF